MGQTLSHGVYLPNEGERNCYAGLASNWQILNTAVGNIAEKAPLVHTHGNITNDGKVGTTANLPLITGTGGAVQTGAFGNQANTFCEGNDSRLSDARTPVAHTHTKSDVTDLLNSNFIPSANNSYDLGTSTNKWKSLNGVNPGALSLPDLSVSQNVDTNGWVYNGTTLNSVLLNSGDTNVTKNGWLYIRTNNTVAGDRVAVRLKNITAEDPTTIAGEIGFGHIEVFVPLVAGYQAYVFTNKAPTYIKFYPCLGNVPSGV